MKLLLEVNSAQEDNLTNVSLGCYFCTGVDGVLSGITIKSLACLLRGF